ncbi:MAG: VIT domain-containing protein, partial [Deferrisomatales bacterium]
MGVAVEADLVGRSARVEVTQSFENREEQPVEAVYRFPLPEGAALTGFRARVGERVFEGEVDERDRAFARYDEALEKGHGAYLLDEERPNIFTLSVGNLNPGARAELTLTYVEALEEVDGAVRFRFPTTISPRYVPADAPDEGGVPAADRLHPPYAGEVPYGLRLRVRVHARDAVAAVESPTHPVRCALGEDPVEVELSADSTRMDRDFVLLVRPREAAGHRAWAGTAGPVEKGDGRGDEAGDGTAEGTGEAEGFVQVDFALPPDLGKGPAAAPAGEVVFLLDCSGSMGGSSIAQAKRALEILLRALPPEASFNLVRFGSTFKSFWPAARPADPAHVGRALARLARVDADLGGTEILAPLRAIYQSPAGRPGPRSVLLLTDGEVGNEAEVVALARSAPGRVRVFTVGIGHGPNDYLVRQTARASGGASVLVAPGERIEPAVLGLFGKVLAQGVTGVCLEHPGLEPAPREACAFPGQAVSLFGRLPAGAGPLPAQVTVSGTLGGERREWVVPVKPWDGARAAVPQLWAREAIRDLEEGGSGGSRQAERRTDALRGRLLELSRRYGVVCRETSFVVVEEREETDRTTGEAVLRRVPV